MANMQKYARHAIGHLCKHFERGLDSAGKPINYSNQEIDLSRSHLNYNLAPARKSQYEFIMERCKEVNCLNRKDVNVMCSWCLTAPKDLPPEEHDRFFRSAYEFMAKRYGEENVISSYVHKDETTPHMHFAFVPVHYDRPKERYSVSAKSVVNRKDLLSFHPDLEKHLTKALGHDVHVMTGELSTRPDMTLSQYKAYKSLCASIEKSEKHAAQLEESIKRLESKLEHVRAEFEPKQAYVAEFAKLQESIYDDVKENKNVFGKVKSVEMPEEKWHKHAMSYMSKQAVERMNEKTLQLIDELKHSRTGEHLSSLESEIATLKKNLTAYQKSYEAMSNEIERVNKVFRSNPKLAKEFFETEERINNTKNERAEAPRSDFDRS